MLGQPYPVSEQALALHRDSLVLDCHSHFLINGTLFRRKFHRRAPRPWFYNIFKNQLDLESATRGGVNVLSFTTYLPGPPWNFHADRSTEHSLDRYAEILDECAGKLVHCISPGEIREAVAMGKLATFLSIEGGHVLKGNIENLEGLYRRGVRMLTLTHFVSNGISDASYSPYRPLRGISDFGREVVREMERLGMMVDVAHCTDTALRQVLETALRPVIYSHGALRRYKKGFERNLTDDLAREIARAGGMIGVIFFHRYLGSAGWTMRAVGRHAADMADLCGPEALCVGTDLDGGTYTPWGFYDASDWPQFTQVLIDFGFSEPEIKGILGDNFLRWWDEHF